MLFIAYVYDEEWGGMTYPGAKTISADSNHVLVSLTRHRRTPGRIVIIPDYDLISFDNVRVWDRNFF